jgi:peroxiredoxin
VVITQSRIVNTLLIFACLLTCADIVSNYVKSHNASVPGTLRAGLDPSKMGRAMNVQGEDWKANGWTLVFAISKSCHFCTASAPFYRQLLTSASLAKISALVISPDPEDSMRAYLNDLRLNIPKIDRVSFQAIGINATPTVAIVNSKGKIAAAWIGQLTRDGQDAVLRFIASGLGPRASLFIRPLG